MTVMRVQLSLGSNVGVRQDHLRAALRALDAAVGVHVTRCSGYYETEPLGNTAQPAFLNLAVEIETDREPLELLRTVKEIERRLGRTPAARWAPRVIDIDIILWESRVLDSEVLTVPHKEFRKRAFVLAPLEEIVPDAVEPVSGLTIAELAARPEVEGRVERLGTLDH